jgi:tRNA(His) guanylyltransferase
MNLDDRMKHYENSVGNQLTLRCPAIARVDGRAFHTFTKGFEKPYDAMLSSWMIATAKELCRQISTAKVAYTQSDEISVLLIDYDNFETQQFFDGRVQKLASVIASIATMSFNNEVRAWAGKSFSTFDCRVFSIPERDVANYFVWRQQDAHRNSILGIAQKMFPLKEVEGKNVLELTEMIGDKKNSEYPELFYNGTIIEKQPYQHEGVERTHWVESAAPVFQENQDRIAKYLT